MFDVKVLCLLLFVFQSVFCAHTEDHIRQKRCIVVQKQSGTHGDSSEDGGGEDDYRAPPSKEPRPNHMRQPDPDRASDDFEEFMPQLLKYRLLPARKDFENLGLKTKLPWLAQRKPWNKRGNSNKNIMT